MTRRLPLLALPLLLAACATPPQSQPPQTLYHYQLGEGTDDRPLSLAQAVDRVRDADIVLVGELHSHPAVHLLQANLLAELAEKNLLQNEKLTHMGQRTTRGKLMSYLSAEAQRLGRAAFEDARDEEEHRFARLLRARERVGSKNERHVVRRIESPRQLALRERLSNVSVREGAASPLARELRRLCIGYLGAIERGVCFGGALLLAEHSSERDRWLGTICVAAGGARILDLCLAEASSRLCDGSARIRLVRDR